MKGSKQDEDRTGKFCLTVKEDGDKKIRIMYNMVGYLG